MCDPSLLFVHVHACISLTHTHTLSLSLSLCLPLTSLPQGFSLKKPFPMLPLQHPKLPEFTAAHGPAIFAAECHKMSRKGVAMKCVHECRLLSQS
jgi:hypothetical protein